MSTLLKSAILLASTLALGIIQEAQAQEIEPITGDAVVGVTFQLHNFVQTASSTTPSLNSPRLVWLNNAQIINMALRNDINSPVAPGVRLGINCATGQVVVVQMASAPNQNSDGTKPTNDATVLAVVARLSGGEGEKGESRGVETQRLVGGFPILSALANVEELRFEKPIGGRLDYYATYTFDTNSNANLLTEAGCPLSAVYQNITGEIFAMPIVEKAVEPEDSEVNFVVTSGSITAARVFLGWVAPVI